MTDEDDEFGLTSRSTSRGRAHLQAIAELLADTGPRLQIGAPLGRGSMGIVREARQRVLGRDVAVKAPLTRDVEDLSSILQEAWVAGLLEHPNIVPIYDIEVIDGLPHVVMKKLDGVSWAEVIDHADEIARRFGETDALEWNLRVLISVCNAVEYAHSRGVLHRDIKPSNVMIGSFGEVRLVDWGIAVSLVEAHRDRLPMARDQADTSGTPAYMAPEMAEGDGSRLSERTDIYLLGATLYRILAGAPLRTGGEVEVLFKALTQPVRVDPEWPLAELLARTLANDPAHRPATVAEFRGAIQSWLSRRGSLALIASARERLAALRDAVGATPDAPIAHRSAVYDLFSACRFGFEEAARAAPEPAALAGARETYEVMIGFELAQGDDRAAQLLLDRLDPAPEPLTQAVAALRARRESARTELEVLRTDADPKVAWEARVVVMAAIGAVWVCTPTGSSWMGVPHGYARELSIAGITAVLSSLVVIGLFPWLVKSRINRLFIIVMILGPALAFLLNVGGWLAGISSEITGAIELFIYFTLALVVSLLAEWRILPGTLGFLIAYFLSMAFPGTTLLWMAIANVVLVVNALVIWLPYRWRNELPEDAPLL